MLVRIIVGEALGETVSVVQAVYDEFHCSLLFRGIVDLKTGDPHTFELVADTGVLGMAGVAVQRFDTLELRIKDNVAGERGATEIEANLEMLESGNKAPEFSNRALTSAAARAFSSAVSPITFHITMCLMRRSERPIHVTHASPPTLRVVAVTTTCGTFRERSHLLEVG